MVDKKRVSIRDLNATVDHDFPFALGKELVIDKHGNRGIVENAVWEGKPDAPATFYTVTYYIKDENDEVHELSLNDLLPS